MKIILPVISLLGMMILPVFANEDPEQAKQEKIEWFTEIKQSADRDTKELGEQLASPDQDEAFKSLTTQMLQAAQKMMAVADTGIAAAKEDNGKAVRTAEDEIGSIRDAKDILDLKRESLADVKCLKENIGNDPVAASLIAKVEQEYASLVTKEEESQALHKQSELCRRKIQSLKLQIRIAELDREKKRLESQ